jgi:hypothetical protein
MTRAVAPKGSRSGCGGVQIEVLEGRVFLSAGGVPHANAVPTFKVLHSAGVSPFLGAAFASGITPAQMAQAYGVNQVRFGSVAGTGAGQTIAIIDAYDDPNALSDLAAFDTYYGLPNPPSLAKLNESGSAAALPGVDPGAKGSTWELEESLDIEWAHAIAPQANLILYEANSPSWSDLMAAVGTAVSDASVTAISMSFGSAEQPGETYYDGSFVSPHATFLASTGDTGGAGSYPSASPNVLAVGGTGLSVDASGNYLGEYGWSGSNGGLSTIEGEPGYQGSAQSTGRRTTPDVSMDADPGTGVPVFDSFDGGASTPWFTVGGTSLATPMWASLIAIADQGRTINGLAPFASGQAQQMLYSAPAADFHDVTAGSNAGFSAGPGYDQVTGLGSPVASQLVPYLAGFTAQSASASAAFVATDTTTKGTWGGAYGLDGYDVFNDSASLPAYAQLSLSNAMYCTWASPTADPRALQDSPAAGARTASCAYSPTAFSLDLNLTDGAAHPVALYLCDYDWLGRSESVQVTNAATGAVLDARAIWGFGGGQYLDYNLSGHVRITISNNPGSWNAVLGGIFFGAPAASATYSGVDATRGGQWTGAYGTDGDWVLGGPWSVPSYATMSVPNAQTCVWATSTTDLRDLQVLPGSISRVAGCVYSPSSFSVDLNLTDGRAHQVSFYLLDWDRAGRTETIQVADASTGRVLDTRSAAGFGNGQYVSWNLSGHVKITFTNTGPLNAVLGGVFFDPPAARPAATSSAAFLAADASTRGTWSGAYGAEGYDLFSSNASMPAYAQLGTTPGQLTCTWADSTTDPRALQQAPGSAGRIESCFYAWNSFSLDLNLTDGNAHRVALYVADYDYQGRSEQVQLSDAATGAVLDTRSVSNFAGGQYLAWNMSGHVKITVTRTGGVNAVASGIFFG